MACRLGSKYLLELTWPLIGVEKSPETSGSDLAMRRMHEAFPRVRYIHLVRHPSSTVASMVEAWRGLDYWDVPDDRAPPYCLEVGIGKNINGIAAFGAGIRPDRFLRVRAEHVVNNPKEALPMICRWLAVGDSDVDIGG